MIPISDADHRAATGEPAGLRISLTADDQASGALAGARAALRGPRPWSARQLAPWLLIQSALILAAAIVLALGRSELTVQIAAGLMAIAATVQIGLVLAIPWQEARATRDRADWTQAREARLLRHLESLPAAWRARHR